MTQEAPRSARPRPQFRAVSVKRVDRITPGVVRITVGGDELAGFEPRGQAGHVRFWFPQPGEAAPIMPDWGDNGPVMREGVPRPEARVYTPRIWDADKRELSVDFIIHGEGPGSSWAESAKPGDRIVIAGPGGRFQVDPSSDWYLLAADQTGIPALATVLEALPESIPAQVYVEVEDASEEQDLPSSKNVTLTLLHRAPNKPMGAALLDAVTKTKLPADGAGRVWVACESAIMHDIRRHLLEERKLNRTAMHTHGYWKLGAENHPDHDYGDD